MPAKSKKASAANVNVPRPLASITSSKSTPTANTEKETDRNGHSTEHPTTAKNVVPAGVAAKVDESVTLVDNAIGMPQVNRKKQKRREKEAAKRAAEQQVGNGIQSAAPAHNGQMSYSKQGRGPRKGYFDEEQDYVDPDFADEPLEGDEAFFSGDEDADYTHGYAGPNGHHDPSSWMQRENPHSKKRKNKRNSGTDGLPASTVNTTGLRSNAIMGRTRAPLSNAALRSAHKMSNDQIWNTSSQAERDNIKQFWLELGEEERRSLVKVEKEAVLRKMKEQQKHSCSCSVCGRKRTAIEEELEVLYDAYYEELEQFANNGNDLSNGHPMLASSRAYKQLRAPSQPMAGSYPSRGRVHELGEDDDELDEEDYDEDDEPYSDEELDEPGPPDFFTFGNSLTVKDGILTVADDLLKNDGKHFIDMMEQLAERRMQREEEIFFPSPALAHQDFHQGHNHPPLDEDDDYDDDDDEDDEDYDSQEDDEFENDEMDSMTEDQRMEEGRRMFQIFAARMFEQRVLTAYREKVAAERQQKLLDELEQEGQLDAQREAKKAREAAKKKEKKRLQKQAKEEEKAKRDSEKAAQEAAVREVEEKKLEEQRQRKEEQRKKREAERKAAEDERLRKEAEKSRRAQEERERQAEAERKQREAKEKEKRKREEAKQKERVDREAREKEARERKAKEEKDRKAKEDQDRKEKDAIHRSDRESKDRARHETVKRQPIALPPGLHPPANTSNVQSPHLPIATPIIPTKAPTPGRPRQPSYQGQHSSHTSSPRSQQANTETSHSSASPASIAVPQTPSFGPPQLKSQGQTPMLHHPQPSAPLSPLNNQNRNSQPPFNVNGLPGLGLNGPVVAAPGMMAAHPQMLNYQGQAMSGQTRMGPPHGIQFPPGFGGPRQFLPNQQMPYHSQAPMHAPISAPQQPLQKVISHSRQASGANQDLSSQPAPIARPGPIGRPSSTTPDKQQGRPKPPDVEIDHLATQLGSKALLDDSDIPFASKAESTTNIAPLGPPGSGRAPFSNSFPDAKFDNLGGGGSNWSTFSPNTSNSANWGAPGPNTRPGAAWKQPTNNAFGAIGAIGSVMQGIPRPHAARPFAIRTLLAQACRQLSSAPGGNIDGYIPAQTVLRQVEAMKSPTDPPVTMDEMLTYCETEGNPQNGGGSFEVRNDGARGPVVKFLADTLSGGRNTVGDIGSPIISHASFGGIGQGYGAPGRSF